MVKNIAIMDEVYALLSRNKREGESFSKEILRLFNQQQDVLTYAGAWKISSAEAERMKKAIYEVKLRMTKELLQKAKQ